MSKTIRSASDAGTWGPALDEAVNALNRSALIVLPTDTVYGIGADAFNPDAVNSLLAAKGRGRHMPPPVLIGAVATMAALAVDIPDGASALAHKFWPGGLTLIFRAQPSLAWDLGETQGTVALRMPDHPTALALLTRTGPLAVSSANISGQPAAVTAQEAFDQLGGKVALYLDAEQAPGQVASTIIDTTGPRLKVVREGAISLEQLREVTDVAAIDEDIYPTDADDPAEAEGSGDSVDSAEAEGSGDSVDSAEADGPGDTEGSGDTDGSAEADGPAVNADKPVALEAQDTDPGEEGTE